MCEDVFKNIIPDDTENLKDFFQYHLGGKAEVKDYIEHVGKYGFFSPYERNLRIKIFED